MSLSELKVEFSNKRIQQLELSEEGKIIETDNAIFNLKKGSQLSEIHPFFEAISTLLSSITESITFPCVNVEKDGISKILDVEILARNNKLFLLLFDFTEHYQDSHPLVQEKNEASIAREKLTFETRLLNAKEEFKNSFLANLNHEIRNPLNNMLGFLDILKDTKLSYDQQETLKIARNTGTHIKLLMDDMLDISKIERGVMEVKNFNFNLYHITSSVQKHFQLKHRGSPIEFKISVAEETPKVLIGDPVRLKQIIHNLIENAFRNTKKGSIELIVSDSKVRVEENQAAINFTVKDTGIGIPKDKMPLIFDSYFQLELGKLKPIGEGLGLKIVKDLVDLLEGTIETKSEVDKGTTFSVDLTFTKRKAGREKKTIDKGSGIVLSKRILIAEDDPTNQMLLMKTFLNNDKGYMLEIAGNGKQALDLLEKKTYQLIIMKTNLPDVDAVSFIELIKSHENESIQSIPVLVATGNTLVSEEQKIRNAGADEFLPKPYNKKELFKIIENLLNR